jgi:tRNA nucleotidyltransferase/poly(A) polymerase
VLDPFGGRGDFECKILRAVNSETAGRDPLMTLRALRFVALYDFTVDPATAAALSNALKQPDTLSSMNARRDRLQYEFTRLFAAEGLPSKALEFGEQIKVFDRLFPKIAEIQRNEALWTKLLTSSDKIAKQYEHVGKESLERKAAQLANLARHFLLSNGDQDRAACTREFLAEICHSQEDITQALASLELP